MREGLQGKRYRPCWRLETAARALQHALHRQALHTCTSIATSCTHARQLQLQEEHMRAAAAWYCMAAACMRLTGAAGMLLERHQLRILVRTVWFKVDPQAARE